MERRHKYWGFIFFNDIFLLVLIYYGSFSLSKKHKGKWHIYIYTINYFHFWEIVQRKESMQMKNAWEKCTTKLWVQPVEVCSISLKAVLKNQFWFDNYARDFIQTYNNSHQNDYININLKRFTLKVLRLQITPYNLQVF